MDAEYTSLINLLPGPFLAEVSASGQHDIDEIILDVGRPVEIREKSRSYLLKAPAVTYADIDSLVSRISPFTEDNRSGLDKTLHRISAMRNRKGRIIGLTLRVGRAVFGSAEAIKDLLDREQSILIMGPPGIGKTTRLREISRVLADRGKRVVIVDTSNEIAGEGDIPHPGIGAARRMQVSHPELQHAVMIEAVENHMPEVIVVDEIGTEAEARAARTIAERGVMLVATAHGQTIHNLIKNPTLSDLIGGIETVTLGDEEAKRRGTQKTILERASTPTFEILIELIDRFTLHCYKDVARSVDNILKGQLARPEVRKIQDDGAFVICENEGPRVVEPELPTHIRIFPFAINRANLELGIKSLGVEGKIVSHIDEADLIVTTKAYLRKDEKLERMSHEQHIPLHIVKSATQHQINKFLKFIFRLPDEDNDPMSSIDSLVKSAIDLVQKTGQAHELPHADSHIRRLQHQLISQQGFRSQSIGKEPERRVKIYGKS